MSTLLTETPRSEAHPLLHTGAGEQRALLALAMVDDSLPAEFYRELFSRHLNWPWIFMQAMQHRVLGFLWEGLISRNLVDAAVDAGLAKNWITYAEQLCRANREKNEVWLDTLERVSSAAQARGVPLVAIKGAALIGDIYHRGNRMLGDIDTLVTRDGQGEITALLHDLGFERGTIDPVTSSIRPLEQKDMRFWSFHSHIAPKFTLATGKPSVPFVRLAIGFDFYDPHDDHAVPSEAVVARRKSRAPDSAIEVTDEADTILNLCAHIYREGISATFGYAGENWGLWKFCDLRTYLLRHDSPALRGLVADRVRELGLERPHHYALHYLQQLYGDQELKAWADLCDPGPNLAFLEEMVDGNRRVPYRRPFADKLFDFSRIVLPGLEPAWAKQMGERWW